MQQLEKEINRLNELFHNLEIALLMESEDRIVINANPFFFRLFGLPEDLTVKGLDCAVMARNAAPLFEEPEKFLSRLDDILAEKNIVRNEKLNLKDGRSLERDFVPVFSEGTFIGNVWVYRDITEKEASSKALIESEAIYKLLSENTSDGIALVEDNQLKYASDGLAKMLGYTREELYAMDIEEIQQLIHPEDLRARVKKLTSTLNKNVKYLHQDIRIIKKGGEKLWVSEEISRIFNEDGSLKSSVIHARDITLRKNAELELEKSQERFSKLIQNMEEGLVLHDSNGYIIDSNEKANKILHLEKLTGEHSEKFTLRTIRENGEDYPGSEHPAMVTLRTGKSVKNAIMGVIAEGNTTWVKINSEPLYLSDNEDPYAMVTFSDITELKKKEEDLQEINTKKDKLISIIGHDLRNPIQAMKALADISLSSLNQENIEDLTENLQLMSQSANKAIKLINDLLEWGRIESGKLDTMMEDINVEELVAQILDLFKINIQQKELKLNVSIPRSLFIRSSRYVLDLVLRNLISNAIKFTDNKGSILIEVKVADKNIKISVCDSGIGIDEQYLHSIFNMNTNYLRSGTANEKGSGLGLKLCYDHIKKVGGHLTVESNVNEGSTFTISLPSAVASESLIS